MELYEDHRVQVREIVQDIDDSEPLLEKKRKNSCFLIFSGIQYYVNCLQVFDIGFDTAFEHFQKFNDIKWENPIADIINGEENHAKG